MIGRIYFLFDPLSDIFLFGTTGILKQSAGPSTTTFLWSIHDEDRLRPEAGIVVVLLRGVDGIDVV